MRMSKQMMLASALMIVLCLFAGKFYVSNLPKTVEGEKKITIFVVHGDETEELFVYDTDKEYLGEMLLEKELVSGENGPYGLFIQTVDGETADTHKQQWWCITKDGEKLTTSADTTPIADGERYTLTLTEGY